MCLMRVWFALGKMKHCGTKRTTVFSSRDNGLLLLYCGNYFPVSTEFSFSLSLCQWFRDPLLLHYQCTFRVNRCTSASDSCVAFLRIVFYVLYKSE